MDQLLRPDSAKHRAGSSASDDSSSSGSSTSSSLGGNSSKTPLTFTHIMGQGRVNQLGGVFINGRPLPHHIRLKIIELAAKGIKPCHISRQLRVSHGCVSKILYRYAETGTIVPGQIGGASKQSRKVVEGLEQKALEIHQQNPDIPAAQIRSLLMAGGLCTRSDAPSTHTIAKLIRTQQKANKKALKHSISGILGEGTNEDDDLFLNESASLGLSTNGNQNNNRRCRTWFSPEQLECLERAFHANTYPNSQQREQISTETGLSEAKIQVWFSNRRARFRKSVTSASLEQWNSSLQLGNFDLPTQTPSPQLAPLSPMDLLFGAQQAAEQKMEAEVEETEEQSPQPQTTSLFPSILPQFALFQNPNSAQLFTSLMLLTRPEYVQQLLQLKQSD